MCMLLIRRESVYLYVYISDRPKKERRRVPTNVNFPPVVSKMIKMTDILLLINLRRTAGVREQKGYGGKQKLINHMHLS